MPESPITFRPDPARRAAYQQAASAAGLSLGRWLLLAGDAALPAKVRKTLDAPRPPHRPKAS